MQLTKEENINATPTNTLKKEIGVLGAISLVVGMVIGSGIFFKPAIVFKNAGSPFMGIMAWLIGGIITMASALTVAEIASAIPKTGGAFAYLKELYGEKVAFLFGWVQTVIYVPGATAALGIVFATQATYFIPMSNTEQKMLAMSMILFIMLINMLSTKLGSKLQFIVTIGKLVPILIIIAIGLINGTAHSMSTPFQSTGVGAGFGAAILGTLWAYDGWIAVGNIAGELKNPTKDLPKSIITGVLVIIAVYALFNLAIINIMPVGSVVASEKVASDAATILFGKSGAAFITGGVLISIFGALNGYLMAGVRIPFAMAQDGLLPFSKKIGKVSDKFQTPMNAFILEVSISLLYVLSGSFDSLTNLVTFVLWIFFTMTVGGVFILRTKHKHLKAPYKVPFYPVVPLIGVLGGLYILVSTLITNTEKALLGLGITLIGLPVYMFIKKKSN